MATRIEVNVRTGQQTIVALTPSEEAEAVANAAAEAGDPIRVEHIALGQLRADAKATGMFTAVQNATLTQINNWVDNNFPGMTVQQRSLIKLLAAVAGMYLRER